MHDLGSIPIPSFGETILWLTTFIFFPFLILINLISLLTKSRNPLVDRIAATISLSLLLIANICSAEAVFRILVSDSIREKIFVLAFTLESAALLFLIYKVLKTKG